MPALLLLLALLGACGSSDPVSGPAGSMPPPGGTVDGRVFNASIASAVDGAEIGHLLEQPRELGRGNGRIGDLVHHVVDGAAERVEGGDRRAPVQCGQPLPVLVVVGMSEHLTEPGQAPDDGAVTADQLVDVVAERFT